MAYNEDDYLMLSGIQHFYFCKRQWTLIHIEQQWSDNVATKEGELLHDRSDDPYLKESRGKKFYSRAVPVSSKILGLSGTLDVVEFTKSDSGISVKGKSGLWTPHIIEYKRGKPKNDDRDVVQLVAEVICLEENLNITMTEASFYYAAIKRRQLVEITDSLRNAVIDFSKEMHDAYDKKIIPPATQYKNCSKCSLYDICMPRITKKPTNINNYIRKTINNGIEME